MPTIPVVCIDVAERNGTTRNMFTAEYELPLVEAIWSQEADITVRPVSAVRPGGRAYPITEFDATMAQERARLARKYEKHPSTKQPLFEAVYGFGRFEEAFNAVVNGKKAAPAEPEQPTVAEDAEVFTPSEPLTKISGVGKALACDLRTRFGVESIEDVASLTVEDLTKVGGIGKATAQKILDSAQSLTLTE